MSIKKIPICPFCKKEMKKEQVEKEQAVIPTEIKFLPELLPELHASSYAIIDYIDISVFICEGCGFIALWRGEP